MSRVLLTATEAGCSEATLSSHPGKLIGGNSALSKARSSVVEHYLDTVGVDSSILSAHTVFSPRGGLNRQLSSASFAASERDVPMRS